MSIEILRPNAAGAYCNIPLESGAVCPNHYQNVDEEPTDESTTCLVNNTTTEQRDAYNLEASSIPGGSPIKSVTVYFRFRSSDTGIAYGRPGLRISTDETLGTEIPTTGTSYTTYSEALARPGGGSWALADLADLQVIIGLKRGTGSNYANCTQVYVEVDYGGVTATLRPNAAGDEGSIPGETGSPFPNHYLNVDEVTSDAYTTTVQVSTTLWERDLYNIDYPTGVTGTITDVQVFAICIKQVAELSGYPSAKLCIKAPDKTVVEGDEEAIGTTWTTVFHQWATNPWTLDAWTFAELINLQIGVALRSYASGGVGGGVTYCTQVYVTVTFTLQNEVFTPTTLALTITGYAPDILTPSSNQTITPTTLALVITGFAPTVTSTVPDNVSCVPTTLAITITTYAPTVSTSETTLHASQKSSTLSPLVRLTLSKAGEDDIVLEQDRVLHVPAHINSTDSQTLEIIFDNSDGYFTDLDLKGWDAVFEWGLVTAVGDEYIAQPPLKVISQQMSSWPGALHCRLSLIGIPDRLAEDKASGNYELDSTSTKTVKDLISEIAAGVAVGDVFTEEQTQAGNFYDLYYDNNMGAVGQKIANPNRTITAIAFWLKKTQNPRGYVTYKIVRVSDGETLLTLEYNCEDISATAAWCEVELDTPLLVNQAVYIYCQHLTYDWLNYVQVGWCASDVKDNEYLFYIPWTSGLTEQALYDCTYYYKYQATGVSIYSHCEAYEVVYDTEDDLIDSYMPKDSFMIHEGDSRLSILDRYLGLTGCVKRIEADSKIHIMVPVDSGTGYDYEYALEESYHNFFSKSTRESLVIPNQITVKTFDSDTAYSGSATSAASYALLPINDYVRTKLESNAQATTIAEAMIGQLEMNAQRGSASVPMNLGAKLYDYVKVTKRNSEDDSRTGNLGYIKRSYTPGKTWLMEFSFGKATMRGAPGARPSAYKARLTYDEMQDNEIVRWGSIVSYLTNNLLPMLTDEMVDLHNTVEYLKEQVKSLLEG